MLKTFKGSNDGIKVEDFFINKIYSVAESLANAFVNQLSVAEYFIEEKMVNAPQNKMIQSSPSNKNGRKK
jgi:hypothetical protein